MSTPFTLEPPGAVGELERRATFPVMPPALSRGRPPTQGTRVGGRGQWRATNPGRSRLRHRKVGEKAQRPSVATHGAGKARPAPTSERLCSSRLLNRCGYLRRRTVRFSEARTIFRGSPTARRDFPGDRAITCRAAIPLIFLGSSFLRSFAPRSVQAKGTRSAAFLLESPFTIASRLDTTDRFFPTAPIAARPETGISPGEMASRAQPWLIDRAWTAPD